MTESMALAITGTVCTGITLIFSMFHIDFLWKTWSGDHPRLYVVAICSIAPVWAVLSWFCVIFPDSHNGILVLIDGYEGFVLFSFVHLMKEYLGGFHAAARQLRNQPPFRLLRCLCLVQPDEKFLMGVQILVYQFCILKPLLAIIRAALEVIGVYENGSFAINSSYLWLSFFRISSLVIAMIALFVFYRCCRDTLSRFNIVIKFAVIKILITLHIVQMTVFTAVIKYGLLQDAQEIAEVRAIRMQYLLSAIEMMFLAFLLPFAYPAKEKKGLVNEDIGLESFQLFTRDLPQDFDSRSVDTLGEFPVTKNKSLNED